MTSKVTRLDLPTSDIQSTLLLRGKNDKTQVDIIVEVSSTDEKPYICASLHRTSQFSKSIDTIARRLRFGRGSPSYLQ